VAERDEVPKLRARDRLLVAVGTAVLRLLRVSVRLRFHGDRQVRDWERARRRFILAFWHRHMMLMRYAYRGDRMTVLSSQSRDGERMVQILRRLGIGTVRGSSTRGGVGGLRELIRAARGGSDLGITPDGPKGPARRVQPGVIAAAAASGLPIVPVAMAATRGRFLSTWDRMLLPLPGAVVHVVYGQPLEIPRDGRPEEWSPRLEEALERTGDWAEREARSGAR